MLYRGYEVRQAVTTYVADVVSANAKMMARMAGPFAWTYPVQASLAAAEVAEQLRFTHERPAFRIDSTTVDGRRVAITEEVVAATPFASLVHFGKKGRIGADAPKVLIVPGLAGHFATLVRGTVTAMLPDHDVYVADWHNARDVPVSAGRFGLDEYIEHLMSFVREIHATGQRAHLMAVCQPAVACIAAAALMAEDDDPAQPASLILLAGPVDARVNPGRVNKFAERQPGALLESTMLRTVPRGHDGAGRRVYPGYLQISGFLGMDPRRHVRAFNGMFRDLRHGDEAASQRTKDFYDEYFAVLDIAGEFFVETARSIFRDHDLARGEFHWRGRHVDPGAIRTALFTIEGGADEICPPGQTFAAQALCSAVPAERREHLLQEGVGHYGVFAGSRFENEVYPRIRAFIAAQ